MIITRRVKGYHMIIRSNSYQEHLTLVKVDQQSPCNISRQPDC